MSRLGLVGLVGCITAHKRLYLAAKQTQAITGVGPTLYKC